MVSAFGLSSKTKFKTIQLRRPRFIFQNYKIKLSFKTIIIYENYEDLWFILRNEIRNPRELRKDLDLSFKIIYEWYGDLWFSFRDDLSFETTDALFFRSGIPAVLTMSIHRRRFWISFRSRSLFPGGTLNDGHGKAWSNNKICMLGVDMETDCQQSWCFKAI